MAKQQPKGELVVLGFDYSLVGDSADKVRSSAEKIRRTVQKTIEDIIEGGRKQCRPRSWAFGLRRCWSGTRKNGRPMICPNLPANFGSLRTPWRSRSERPKRRRRNDNGRRFVSRPAATTAL